MGAGVGVRKDKVSGAAAERERGGRAIEDRGAGPGVHLVHDSFDIVHAGG